MALGVQRTLSNPKTNTRNPSIRQELDDVENKVFVRPFEVERGVVSKPPEARNQVIPKSLVIIMMATHLRLGGKTTMRSPVLVWPHHNASVMEIMRRYVNSSPKVDYHKDARNSNIWEPPPLKNPSSGVDENITVGKEMFFILNIIIINGAANTIQINTPVVDIQS
ncbi:hypothetical protein Tco_1517170, partial [Tanacetum coccineum]